MKFKHFFYSESILSMSLDDAPEQNSPPMDATVANNKPSVNVSDLQNIRAGMMEILPLLKKPIPLELNYNIMKTIKGGAGVDGLLSMLDRLMSSGNNNTVEIDLLWINRLKAIAMKLNSHAQEAQEFNQVTAAKLMDVSQRLQRLAFQAAQQG